MAVKPKVIKKVKVAKPRITKAAVKSIDLQYNGTEPIDISIKGYTQALNWYNYEYDVDKAREWLLEYLKKNSTKEIVAAVRKCPKYRLPTTMGWMARIMMNGNVLEQRSMDTFNRWLDEIIAAGKAEVEVVAVVVDKPTISIQERTQAKSDALFAECEVDVVDARGSMYSFLQANEVSSMAANHIKAKYQPIYDEIMSDDEQVKEAFGKKLKEERAFWQTVIDDLDRYVGNKKATKVRKPREKKQKSAVDLVKSLTFQKEFAPLKIVSINPAEIIGANQLWAYNTKTRKLTVFNALGPSGLQVKGASVIGFDVERSTTKRLRKPDTAIQQLLGAGKVGLRKFMDEIAAVPSEAKGRINNDTILLRVIK